MSGDNPLECDLEEKLRDIGSNHRNWMQIEWRNIWVPRIWNTLDKARAERDAEKARADAAEAELLVEGSRREAAERELAVSIDRWESFADDKGVEAPFWAKVFAHFVSGIAESGQYKIRARSLESQLAEANSTLEKAEIREREHELDITKLREALTRIVALDDVPTYAKTDAEPVNIARDALASVPFTEPQVAMLTHCNNEQNECRGERGCDCACPRCIRVLASVPSTETRRGENDSPPFTPAELTEFEARGFRRVNRGARSESVPGESGNSLDTQPPTNWRKLLADLVATLPTCDRCDRPATRAQVRGSHRWCDEHGVGVSEYPRAPALRAATEALARDK